MCRNFYHKKKMKQPVFRVATKSNLKDQTLSVIKIMFKEKIFLFDPKTETVSVN